jgi:hypothetical protein
MYLHTGEGLGQLPTVVLDPRAAVVDRFDFDRSALKPAHLAEIDRFAKQVVASQAGPDPVGIVTLVGHTDKVGPPAYNRALGLRRAEAVQAHLKKRLEELQPGLSARLKIVADTRGEDQPRPGDPARSRRVEIFMPRRVVSPPPPTPAATTRDIKIVVKSYIAPVGARIGATICAAADPTAVARLAALAAATDAAFSENPLSDKKDKKYRLYTSRVFRVTCAGGKLLSVTPGSLDTDTGLECVPRTSLCLHPPPMIVLSSSVVRTGPSTCSFSWTAKGRPPRTAEPGFQVVCPRTSWFIWHSVSGTIDCRGPTMRIVTTPTGSRFPSHRVFVDGALTHTIPQGPFSNLWVPNSRDITMVA